MYRLKNLTTGRVYPKKFDTAAAARRYAARVRNLLPGRFKVVRAG